MTPRESLQRWNDFLINRKDYTPDERIAIADELAKDRKHIQREELLVFI